MHSIQKLRWQDVIDDVLFPSGLHFEWIKLEFGQGYENFDRDGLYVTSEHCTAEVSPIVGYFDRDLDCLLAAIDTVSKPLPIAKREEIEVNSLVSCDADISESLLNNRTVKVKVHSLTDCQLVHKVRDFCGSSAKIRVDFNGKFDVEQSLTIISQLSDLDLEYIEQPCPTNAQCAQVRKRTNVAIAIDETARTYSEINEALKLDSADIAVIKVQSSGGIHKAIDLVDLWGKDVVISHMMETQVGLDLGIALAKSLDSLNFACGLSPVDLKKLIREPLYI